MAYYADVTIGSGKEYETLELFEAAYDGISLTGTDGVRGRLTGICQSTSYVLWAGWQNGMSSTCRIVLTADTGEFTDGISSGGCAEINSWMSLSQDTYPLYIDFIGIELSGTAAEISGNFGNSSVLRVIKCLFVGAGTGGKAIAIKLYNTGVVSAYIGGCVFRNFAGAYNAGVEVNDADATAYVYNCTFAEMSNRGVSQYNGTAIVKNCAAINCVNGDFYSCTETTNLSENDGQLSDADGNDFVAPSTYNYHIQDASSALYTAGTAISDSWFTSLCSTDFDGTAWRATPSVGAFEFPSAAAKLLAIIMKESNQFNGGMT